MTARLKLQDLSPEDQRALARNVAQELAAIIVSGLSARRAPLSALGPSHDDADEIVDPERAKQIEEEARAMAHSARRPRRRNG